MNLIKEQRDFFAGALFLSLGLLVIYMSMNYEIGTARQMGPGYFPFMLAGLLIGLASILIVRSFVLPRAAVEFISVRSIILVLGSTLLYAVLLRPAGMLIAVAAAVILSSLASKPFRPLPVIALAAVLAGASIAIFIFALRQPFPVLGYWFRGV